MIRDMVVYIIYAGDVKIRITKLKTNDEKHEVNQIAIFHVRLGVMKMIIALSLHAPVCQFTYGRKNEKEKMLI